MRTRCIPPGAICLALSNTLPELDKMKNTYENNAAPEVARAWHGWTVFTKWVFWSVPIVALITAFVITLLKY